MSIDTVDSGIVAGDARLPVEPGTIVLYSDIHCSFAHLAVHRLLESRSRLGLDGGIWIDHRAFPLELFNERVNSLRGVQSEVSVIGALEPDAGWQLWQAPDWSYPVTTLPALEAVQAAKMQSWAAAEQLDCGLRRAFWAESKCVAMRHVILQVAADCPAIDLDTLVVAMDRGTSRQTLHEHYAQARDGRVVCSPHVFLADGTNAANPGVEVRWIGGPFGTGFPIVDSDDRSIYDRLLIRAAELAPADVTGSADVARAHASDPQPDSAP